MKFNIPVLIFVVILIGTSCKKTFFTDVNVNTNAPDAGSIVPRVLLSTVEGTLAYTQGGDLSRYTSLITQQTASTSRQAGGYYQYTFTSVDFDSPWGNLYTSVMQNNKTLMQMADSKGNNRYSGISRILMAYTLQMSVDMWGSIPYSEAFQGATKLQSKYDTDKALYDTINSLLTVAISQLGSANPGVLLPGSEDVIYGGNAAKWIKFAHAIKARLFIHQSKGVPAMATNALAEISQSFTSNAENAKYAFGSTETSANPWYQFNQQRGDISFDDSPLGVKLAATKDPRYKILTTPDLKDVNQVGMGAYYGEGNAPVELIAYDELLFMKAEATLTATGDVAGAQSFYVSAIRKNMEKLGVASEAIDTFVTTNSMLRLVPTAAIAQVAAQEFIALYLNPEAFTLWRRTNSPTLTPIIGANIPRRFLYPQTEYSYNSTNVPASTTLFATRIFWDK